MTETRTHTFIHTYRQRIKCPGGGGGGGGGGGRVATCG
jgi:hypothetical protein